jgi:hypothetical protein
MLSRPRILAILLLSPLAALAQTSPTLVNLTAGAPPVDLGDGSTPAPFSFYACSQFYGDHFFTAPYLNDLGQVVGRAQHFEQAPVDCDSPITHTGWYLYSNGVMTFPWGTDAASTVTNKQGYQYNISSGVVFGLDNDGAIYVQGFFIMPTSDGYTFFPTARIAADGTITRLPDNIDPYNTRVTLDGRSIVTSVFGGLQIYTRNNKTGGYDGPTVVTVTPPTGYSWSSITFTYGQSLSGDYIFQVKWVNNRLEFIVITNDSAAASAQHSYIYQVVDGAAVMKADLGPDSVATALNEIGWATGYFRDGSGNVVSNFTFRPQRTKKPLEIFDPPPPSQVPTYVPGTLGGNPVPFAITNSGTVAIALYDFSLDPIQGGAYTVHSTLQRAQNGTYTAIGNGDGTVFPSQGAPYYIWNFIGAQQNEQGQIAGGNSWGFGFQYDPASGNVTNYFGAGYDAWLWSPAGD